MHDLKSSLEFLFGLQFFGVKLGLDNTMRLLEALGNPHHRFPSIHVAGTNGKGSTCAMLESIFRAAGYRTGLYTSPHIHRFSERIRVNGVEIEEEEIIQWTETMRPTIEKWQCTFFEATTAMAFASFARHNVEMAVVETGLGGRLDSTNVLAPEVAVITSIGMDHMEHLGPSLRHIGKEKAGIMKAGRVTVVGSVTPDIRELLRTEARQKQSPLVFVQDHCAIRNLRSAHGGSLADMTAGNLYLQDLEIGLSGRHQTENAALGVLTVLQQNRCPVDEKSIRSGLRSVRWPARLQIARTKPTVVLDAAHNPSAMEALVEVIVNDYKMKFGKIVLMIGMLADKECDKVASTIAPHVDRVITLTPQGSRAMPKEQLAGFFKKYHPNVEAASFSTEETYRRILRELNDDDLMIVTGSHYLLADFPA